MALGGNVKVGESRINFFVPQLRFGKVFYPLKAKWYAPSCPLLFPAVIGYSIILMIALSYDRKQNKKMKAVFAC